MIPTFQNLLKCVWAGLLNNSNLKEVRSHGYLLFLWKAKGLLPFLKLITMCIICISFKLKLCIAWTWLCGKLSPDPVKCWKERAHGGQPLSWVYWLGLSSLFGTVPGAVTALPATAHISALFFQITSAGMSLLYLAILCKYALKQSILVPCRVRLYAN